MKSEDLASEIYLCPWWLQLLSILRFKAVVLLLLIHCFFIAPIVCEACLVFVYIVALYLVSFLGFETGLGSPVKYFY